MRFFTNKAITYEFSKHSLFPIWEESNHGKWLGKVTALFQNNEMKVLRLTRTNVDAHTHPLDVLLSYATKNTLISKYLMISTRKEP